MKKKTRVAVLFGGRSAEHEVSLQSAKNVIEAIDKEKYEVIPIAIDKTGRWHLSDSAHLLLNVNDPKLIKLNQSNENVSLLPWKRDTQLMNISSSSDAETIDVVFPVLHGPYGEDGTMQGLLKLSGIPFVGAGVLGSAVGMDKDVMKRLLKAADLPVAKFLVVNKHEKDSQDYDEIVKEVGEPFFVKPANLGSSVGVSKVHNKSEFNTAVDKAFTYDTKMMIEEYLDGREIECAVLGNDNPIASLPGEIIPLGHEFYDYDAKYVDEDGAELQAPADLDKETVKKVQELSIKAFKTLCCEGMARVDFFVKENCEVFVNEINTIPGFTKISMYPKLWQASGISYTELIDRLIQLAIQRHTREQQLQSFL